MTNDITLLAALIAGFVGSTHCIGMCGGIAGALGMSTATGGRPGLRGLGFALLYNAGRIGSYAIAGAIAGVFGLWLGNALNFSDWSGFLRVATGLVMIAIGLQLAVNWRILGIAERAGLRFWQRLAPLAQRLMPVRSPFAALLLGALWGWLPCGLVYGMLLAAAVSGGPAHGAGLMIAFGLGTAPAMVATGAAAARLGNFTRNAGFRRVAGTAVLAMGVWTIASPAALHGLGLHGLEANCSTSTLTVE
jgi:hypothetical protein